MTELNPKAAGYSEKLRVRVCGICIKDDKLLLIKHDHTIGNKAFWAPPGGGLSYGETMKDCLKREMLEETGLHVEINRFLFVNEFMQQPLHAVEFFFEVSITDGELLTGSDPEVTREQQLIQKAQWLPIKEILAIPLPDKHRVLQYLISLDDLLGQDHYFISGK
ncbi:8-oxo-dGTP diphosphatase [Pontibacter aydingkolensis]|uniref:NUDIX domain-containing protein n=1 Tax=Pontibacter aydingkolensis TaxID=1911536 RepID=A0ABS7CV35_9BACT|nr:NUDIX domain-containing protein [Pontibacter aydingkolensis]MBW7467337.1 NUDIX domain-containing protein [Pontibacter aydingkolensis]